jgi:AraC-like DNA-binding protein
MAPAMRDVLADVLAVARLGATAIAQAELVPPWGLEIDPIAEAHVHVVQRGSCWLRTTEQREPVQLTSGDVVLLRAGVGHSICDEPRTTPAPHRDVLAVMPRRLAALPRSRAHETTLVLCAKYLVEEVGPHPLLASFPPLVHIPAREAQRHVQLQLVLELLRHEAIDGGRGSELVVPRLVDSLLVFVVRAWMESQPAGAGGWFGALRDPAITKALSLLHERPDVQWSVEALAREVAQSRATFARRFAALVGETPVAYLTRWRMCVAAKLLAESDLALDAVASRVGYDTVAAFSKAFHRSHGAPPGRFRRARRAAASGARNETLAQEAARREHIRGGGAR